MAVEVRADGDAFAVTVREGGGTTEHRVRIPEGYASELGLEDADPVALVEESFAFLLEREPKESILSSFDVSVVGRYFPEYEHEIASRLAP